jgi:hypothetical protein
VSASHDSGLEQRLGLPEDLCYLVAQYPRETWQDHANIGGMAGFWLQRHGMFRDLGGMLTGAIGEYREGLLKPDAFRQFFVPRLSFFLNQLHGHHQIEDQHYFPGVARAEPRLKRGFDILDGDHHAIHEALERNASVANGFLQVLGQGGDQARRAADGFADDSARLVAMLSRHLDDEEDLIIPLILDRGDQALGGL